MFVANKNIIAYANSICKGFNPGFLISFFCFSATPSCCICLDNLFKSILDYCLLVIAKRPSFDYNNNAVLQDRRHTTGGSGVNSLNADRAATSFALLEEDFFLLQAKAEDILLDTVGLGHKMQEASERHGDTLSSAVLWKALQQQG